MATCRIRIIIGGLRLGPCWPRCTVTAGNYVLKGNKYSFTLSLDPSPAPPAERGGEGVKKGTGLRLRPGALRPLKEI
jgi:hypothetical protein